MGKKRKHHFKSPRAAKVAFGSISGILATLAVHPLDVLKVRLQLAPEVGMTQMFSQIVKNNGYKALYAGLSAGVMRQACYTTTRLGVYYWLYDLHKKLYDKTPSLSGKMRYGVYAGLLGALAGCPSEIVLIRMAADGADSSQRYSGLFDAFSKIYRDEGFGALWRGGGLTLTRSVCCSAVQIGSYSKAREIMSEKRLAKGFTLHLYTSLIASFAAAVVTLPVDLVKTRYQVISDNVPQYSVFKEYLQERGVVALWKGFTPYYTRLSCHTIITFYLFDVINRNYHKNQKEYKIRT